MRVGARGRSGVGVCRGRVCGLGREEEESRMLTALSTISCALYASILFVLGYERPPRPQRAHS
jgi:hypothetical protein